MDQFRPPPARPGPQARAAIAIVLHPRGGTDIALGLVHDWAPAVPAAALSTMLVAEGDEVGKTSALIAGRLVQAGLDPSRLVLAGVGGGQGAALQLAFGQAAVGCAGVLACGDGLLPLAALAGRPAMRCPKMRLIWTADEPLFCAEALGGLLRCLRATGLDAQGAVLARPDRLGRGAEGGPGSSPLPLVRLGAAYLAELVAVALGSTGRLQAHPAGIE